LSLWLQSLRDNLACGIFVRQPPGARSIAPRVPQTKRTNYRIKPENRSWRPSAGHWNCKPLFAI